MDQQNWIQRNVAVISKILTIALFFALIRCIAQALWLQDMTVNGNTPDQIIPFLVGAMIAGNGLLVITIVSFWNKHAVAIGISVLTLGLLVYTKIHYHI